MRLLLAAIVAAAVLSPAWTQLAWAQDKPAPKDLAAIEACIKDKTGRHWRWENCIGLISEACAKDDMRDREVTDCYDRERVVWDSILNTSYRLLRERLDDGQAGKLREMQRAWIDARDKTCGFLYDYFEGTMANPMIAACLSRATGRQALFLRGFADDVAQRK